MQFKKEFSIMFMLILAFSMMSGSSLTIAQEVSILETGDEFDYYSDDSQGFTDDFYSTLYNFSNGNDLVVTSEYRDEYLNSEGDTSITSVLNPNPPFMPNVDVGLIINQEHQVVDGEFYEERFVNDTFDPGRNINESYSEPRDGHFMHYRDTLFAESNSTYAVIPPELMGTEIGAPFPPLPPHLFGSITVPDDPRAKLIFRDVLSGVASYEVNGVFTSFNTINVSSEYAYSFEQKFITEIPFGPEDDPSTEWVEVNGTFYYDYYVYFEYIFDADTGILLERYNYDDVIVTSFMGNDQFTLQNIPGWDVGLWMDISSTHWFEQSMQINFASSFYGNTRPTSSGSNRLEEGDELIYNTRGSNTANANFDFTSPEGTFSSSVDSHADGEGTAFINVYYHEPGVFRAVMENSGTITGEATETENGETFNEPINREFYELEVFETESNDSYEIIPFYNEAMFIEYPWYNDRGRDEETPSFLFGIPDRVPLVGVEEHVEYLNYTINGFEYLIEANVIEVDYHLDDTFQSFFEEANMELSMNIVADGRVKFVYDSWTGVLMEQTEKMSVKITGQPAIGPSLDQSDVDVDFSMSMENFREFKISSHPHEYNSEQTEFPEIPDDGTNETDTNTTEPTSEGPSLDLPFPTLQTVISIVFVTLYMRRRK